MINKQYVLTLYWALKVIFLHDVCNINGLVLTHFFFKFLWSPFSQSFAHHYLANCQKFALKCTQCKLEIPAAVFCICILQDIVLNLHCNLAMLTKHCIYN